MTNYQLYEISKEVANQLIERGIPIHRCNVTISNRLKRVFGNCKRRVRYGEVSYEIKIASFLAEHGDEYGIKSTIAHEFIHTCDGCMNHGKLWKKYGDMVSDLYDINRCDTMESKGINEEVAKQLYKQICDYKYVVICDTCGYTWKYKRFTKTLRNIKNCKCPYCNTQNLEVREMG